MRYKDSVEESVHSMLSERLSIANDIDDLEKKADEAIEQIEDRRYDVELRSEGYKNIFKYGIAFYKKDCLIKMKD